MYRQINAVYAKTYLTTRTIEAIPRLTNKNTETSVPKRGE
jgi:hypothetical protein